MARNVLSSEEELFDLPQERQQGLEDESSDTGNKT